MCNALHVQCTFTYNTLYIHIIHTTKKYTSAYLYRHTNLLIVHSISHQLLNNNRQTIILYFMIELRSTESYNYTYFYKSLSNSSIGFLVRYSGMFKESNQDHLVSEGPEELRLAHA